MFEHRVEARKHRLKDERVGFAAISREQISAISRGILWL